MADNYTEPIKKNQSEAERLQSILEKKLKDGTIYDEFAARTIVPRVTYEDLGVYEDVARRNNWDLSDLPETDYDWQKKAFQGQTAGERWAITGRTFAKTFERGLVSALGTSLIGRLAGGGGDKYVPQYEEQNDDDEPIFFNPDKRRRLTGQYWLEQLGQMGTSVGMITGMIPEQLVETAAIEAATGGVGTFSAIANVAKSFKTARALVKAKKAKNTISGLRMAENAAKTAAKAGVSYGKTAYRLKKTANALGYIGIGAHQGWENSLINRRFNEDEVYTKEINEMAKELSNELGISFEEARQRVIADPEMNQYAIDKAKAAGAEQFALEAPVDMMINGIQSLLNVAPLLRMNSLSSVVTTPVKGARGLLRSAITKYMNMPIWGRFLTSWTLSGAIEMVEEAWEEMATLYGQKHIDDASEKDERSFFGFGDDKSRFAEYWNERKQLYAKNRDRVIDNALGGLLGGLLLNPIQTGIFKLGGLKSDKKRRELIKESLDNIEKFKSGFAEYYKNNLDLERMKFELADYERKMSETPTEEQKAEKQRMVAKIIELENKVNDNQLLDMKIAAARYDQTTSTDGKGSKNVFQDINNNFQNTLSAIDTFSNALNSDSELISKLRNNGNVSQDVVSAAEILKNYGILDDNFNVMENLADSKKHIKSMLDESMQMDKDLAEGYFGRYADLDTAIDYMVARASQRQLTNVIKTYNSIVENILNNLRESESASEIANMDINDFKDALVAMSRTILDRNYKTKNKKIKGIIDELSPILKEFSSMAEREYNLANLLRTEGINRSDILGERKTIEESRSRYDELKSERDSAIEELDKVLNNPNSTEEEKIAALANLDAIKSEISDYSGTEDYTQQSVSKHLEELNKKLLDLIRKAFDTAKSTSEDAKKIILSTLSNIDKADINERISLINDAIGKLDELRKSYKTSEEYNKISEIIDILRDARKIANDMSSITKVAETRKQEMSSGKFIENKLKSSENAFARYFGNLSNDDMEDVAEIVNIDTRINEIDEQIGQIENSIDGLGKKKVRNIRTAYAKILADKPISDKNKELHIEKCDALLEKINSLDKKMQNSHHVIIIKNSLLNRKRMIEEELRQSNDTTVSSARINMNSKINNPRLVDENFGIDDSSLPPSRQTPEQSKETAETFKRLEEERKRKQGRQPAQQPKSTTEMSQADNSRVAGLISKVLRIRNVEREMTEFFGEEKSEYSLAEKINAVSAIDLFEKYGILDIVPKQQGGTIGQAIDVIFNKVSMEVLKDRNQPFIKYLRALLDVYGFDNESAMLSSIIESKEYTEDKKRPNDKSDSGVSVSVSDNGANPSEEQEMGNNTPVDELKSDSRPDIFNMPYIIKDGDTYKYSSSILDASGKSAIGEKAFNALYNPQRIKRVYVRGFVGSFEENKESFKEYLNYLTGLHIPADRSRTGKESLFLRDFLMKNSLDKYSTDENTLKKIWDNREEYLKKSPIPIYAELEGESDAVILGFMPTTDYYNEKTVTALKGETEQRAMISKLNGFLSDMRNAMSQHKEIELKLGDRHVFPQDINYLKPQDDNTENLPKLDIDDKFARLRYITNGGNLSSKKMSMIPSSFKNLFTTAFYMLKEETINGRTIYIPYMLHVNGNTVYVNGEIRNINKGFMTDDFKLEEQAPEIFQNFRNNVVDVMMKSFINKMHDLYVNTNEEGRAELSDRIDAFLDNNSDILFIDNVVEARNNILSMISSDKFQPFILNIVNDFKQSSPKSLFVDFSSNNDPKEVPVGTRYCVFHYMNDARNRNEVMFHLGAPSEEFKQEKLNNPDKRDTDNWIQTSKLNTIDDFEKAFDFIRNKFDKDGDAQKISVSFKDYRDGLESYDISNNSGYKKNDYTKKIFSDETAIRNLGGLKNGKTIIDIDADAKTFVEWFSENAKETIGLIDVEMDNELNGDFDNGKTIFSEENYEYSVDRSSLYKPIEVIDTKNEVVETKPTKKLGITFKNVGSQGSVINFRRNEMTSSIEDNSVISVMTLSEQIEFCKSLFGIVMTNKDILERIKNKEEVHNIIVKRAYDILKNSLEPNGIFYKLSKDLIQNINICNAVIDVYEGRGKTSDDPTYIQVYDDMEQKGVKGNDEFKNEVMEIRRNLEGFKNQQNELETIRTEGMEKLFHIPDYNSDKFWVGSFIEYVNSLNKADISIDDVTEEKMDSEQKKVVASDFDYETESFEKEPVGDFSFYLKSVLSSIPKIKQRADGKYETVRENQHGVLSNAIDEYEDVNKIIKIVGNIIINSQCNWNDFMNNLHDLSEDDSYEYNVVCKMIASILSKPGVMTEQYKKELMSKFSLSYHDMVYIKSVYDKNGNIYMTLNHVSDNKKYAQELSKVKEHLKKSDKIVHNREFNRTEIANNIRTLNIVLKQMNDGEQYSMSSLKLAMSNLFGLRFSTTTLKANKNLIEKIASALSNFYKDMRTNNNWGDTIDNFGNSKIYDIPDINNSIKELVLFDCNESGSTIEKTETISGRRIMTTYQRPLRDKQFKDLQDKTGYYDVVMSIFSRKIGDNIYYRYYQLDNIDNMPFKTGLSSLSMFDMFGKRSQRMVELTDEDQTISECILNQETIGSVSPETEHRILGFNGEYNATFRTRTGYVFSYTVADKNRLPWVRLPKYVIPVSSYKGKTNKSFHTIDFARMIPFVTRQVLDNELLTIESNLKCDLANNTGKHLIMSVLGFNNIVVEIDGKKHTIENVLSSCVGKDEQYINGVFESLREQYDNILEQAKPIMKNAIEREVAKLVFNDAYRSKIDSGESIFSIDGSLSDEAKKGLSGSLWNKAQIYTIDGNDVSEKYYKSDYDKFVIDKAAEDNSSYGYSQFNIIYSAYDIVVNTFLNSQMLQDCFYSPITRFGKVNESNINALNDMEVDMFDENGNIISSVAKRKEDYINSFTQKTGKNLNKRMGGIDGSGRMLDFDGITHYNDNMWGGENHDEYIYLCVAETESPSSIFANILRQQYPDDQELESLISKVNDDTLSKEERSAAMMQIKTNYPKANSYLNIDSTDGAEWISWRECIDIQLAHADISEETRSRLENMYEKFSKDIFDEEDVEYLLDIAFNPDKPMYCGVMPVYDNNGNMATTQMTYVKSASIPLLPQFTKNTPLDNVRKAVEFFERTQRKNVRLAFNSAIKVGNLSSDKLITLNDLMSIGQQIEDNRNSIKDIEHEGHRELKIEADNQESADMFNSILYRMKRSSIDANRKYFHIQMETESHREEVLLRQDSYSYDNFSEYFHDNLGVIVSKRDIMRFKGMLVGLGLYDKLTEDEKNIVDAKDMDIDYVFDRTESDAIDKLIYGDRLNTLYKERKMDDVIRLIDNGQIYVVESTQLDHVLESSGIMDIEERIFQIPQRQIDKMLERGIISEMDITDGKVDGKTFERLRFEMTKDRVEREETELLNSLGVSSIDDMNLLNQDFLRSFSRMIAKELLSRGYSTNIVEQMGLVETNKNGFMEFKIPPFLHASSDKISILMSSLIKNRISKNRLPGNALFTASNEGFSKMKGVDHTWDSKGVVWIDKDAAQRGTLGAVVENGELKLAEVAIAPQFNYRDNNGKMRKIDLFRVDDKTGKAIYLVNENGDPLTIKDGKITSEYESIMLNESMFDEEMLKMMTFRIPLSGHQSACAVKIVAFLPPAMGDMVIVPKEHLKQLGEDFDIDKRFCYIKNYFVDNDGKVRILTKETVDRKIKESNEYRKLYDMIRTDIFNGENVSEDIDRYIWENGESYEKGVSLYKYLSSVKRKLEKRLDENDAISFYQSVFENADNRIQKQISKVLNFDVLEETRDEVIDKMGSDLTDNFVTPYSVSYQKDLRLGNANAKKGVGVWSSALIVSGLIQKRDVNLMENVGLFGDVANVSISFDGNDFTGSLSNITTLDKLNSKIDVISAQQNANVDNAKADVVSMSNQNSVTFNFYTFMAQMGFNKTSMIKTVNDEIKQMDLAYLIAIQPLVKKYTNLKLGNNSVIGKKRSEKSILKDVLKGYFTDDEVERILAGIPVDGLSYDGAMFSVSERYYSGVDGQYLYDTLDKNQDYSQKQLKTFVFFYNVMKYGGFLQQYSKLFNVTSQGIGYTYFDVLEHIEALNSLGSETRFDGLKNLIGDFYEIGVVEDIPSDAIAIEGCRYAIVPNTNEGAVLLHTLNTTSKMFNTIYNVGSSKLNSVYNNINLLAKAAHLPSNDMDKVNRDISRAVKQYVYKLLGDNNIKSILNVKGLFEGTLEEELDRLLNPSFSRYELNKDIGYLETIDRFNNNVKEDKVISSEKVNLGYIINFLKDANLPIMSSNKFLNALSVTKDGALMFKPNANEIANKDYHRHFFDLYNNTDVMQVNGNDIIVNGEKLTYRALAQDLATYAYLCDDENGVLNLREYIPIEYLDLCGIPEMMRHISNNFDTYFNENEFISQFLLSYPESIRTLSIDNDTRNIIATEGSINNFDNVMSFDINVTSNEFSTYSENRAATIKKLDIADPRFVETTVPLKYVKVRGKKKDNIFELTDPSKLTYTRIDKQSFFGTNELNPYSQGSFIISNPNSTSSTMLWESTNDKAKVYDMIDSNIDHDNNMTRFILPVLALMRDNDNYEFNLVVDNTSKDANMTTSVDNGILSALMRINSNNVDSHTVMEELMHMVQQQEILRVFNNEIIDGVNVVGPESGYRDSSDKGYFSKSYELFKDVNEWWKINGNDFIRNNSSLIDKYGYREQIAHTATNFYEFMAAGASQQPVFDEMMKQYEISRNKKKGGSIKQIIMSMKNAIKAFINKLFKGAKSNVTRTIVAETIDYIDSNFFNGQMSDLSSSKNALLQDLKDIMNVEEKRQKTDAVKNGISKIKEENKNTMDENHKYSKDGKDNFVSSSSLYEFLYNVGPNRKSVEDALAKEPVESNTAIRRGNMIDRIFRDMFDMMNNDEFEYDNALTEMTSRIGEYNSMLDNNLDKDYAVNDGIMEYWFRQVYDFTHDINGDLNGYFISDEVRLLSDADVTVQYTDDFGTYDVETGMRIAGTPDLIFVSNDGQIHIIDFKNTTRDEIGSDYVNGRKMLTNRLQNTYAYQELGYGIILKEQLGLNDDFRLNYHVMEVNNANVLTMINMNEMVNRINYATDGKRVVISMPKSESMNRNQMTEFEFIQEGSVVDEGKQQQAESSPVFPDLC